MCKILSAGSQCLMALAALGAVQLSAAQARLSPVADTTLFEGSPDNNMGASTTLIVGGTNHGPRGRALLRFNVASALPAGAKVTVVTLTLTVVKDHSGTADSFDLSRVSQNWSEGAGTGQNGSSANPGETTWNNRLAPNQTWSAPGAASPSDYTAAASATTSVGGTGSYTFASTSGLVADVQQWLDTPSANFGWILISESEGVSGSARRLGAREDSANGAVLTIQYQAAAQAPQIAAQPQSQTADAGATVTFSVTATGTVPLGYQWQFNGSALPGATSATFVLNNVTADQAGNYLAIVSNSAGSATSAVAVLTVNLPPTITSQPQSQTVNAGGYAAFSVAASGTPPLTYQWQFNGANLAGATSPTLSLSNVTADQAGNYAVAVANNAGSATSAVAILTVNVPPTITGQPQSQTVSAGANTAFAVTAAGTLPLTFQWQFNGGNLAGATSSSLTLTNVQGANAGSYTVTVTNPAGSVTSGPAVLTVANPVGATITSIVVSGGQVTITWQGGQGPFQLQKKVNLSDATWQNIGAPVTGSSASDAVAGSSGFYRVAGQ